MGLVDHQWALVRAGRASMSSFLELTSALGRERDADVLLALHKPLAFLADHLVPDAAPECTEPFRRWLEDGFARPFSALGWMPARDESDDVRLRRAALLGIVGGVAESPAVVGEAALLCDRYLSDRRAIDANLADGVVGLAARVGDVQRHRSFLEASATSATPQEQRRFLLALGSFRDPKLVDRTLALTLTDAVATQDVVFLLARLLANPAARERTWRFVRASWPKLQRRLPSLLASRLVESTWHLLTPSHRREVARFFREHPVPSGERALRQTLERFDWYRAFRRPAAQALRDINQRDVPRR
jgi:aminopeptidase N